MKARLLVFLVVQILFGFVSWCGGYDFNERGGHVATVAVISLFFGFFAAGFPGLGDKP